MKPTRTGPRPGARDDVERLLAFLHERDAACPLCGYNLRNLTRPECPECHQDLSLTVGIDRPRFGWFLITIAPSIFSGIAALILTSILLNALVFFGGGGPIPAQPLIAVTFCWISGSGALLLARRRLAFIRLAQQVQRLTAILTWAVHVGMFFLLLLSSMLF